MVSVGLRSHSNRSYGFTQGRSIVTTLLNALVFLLCGCVLVITCVADSTCGFRSTRNKNEGRSLTVAWRPYPKLAPRNGAFIGSGWISRPPTCYSGHSSAVIPVETKDNPEDGCAEKKAVICEDSTSGRNLKSAHVHLNTAELGIIKVVNCYIVLDVHATFPEIYGHGADYSQYTSSVVRRLFHELDAHDCGVLLKAYRATWPTAEAVSLCRGFQALMTHMYRKKDYEGVSKVLVDLLDHPFLLRTYMFYLSSVSAYVTYVDGWVLPLLLLNVFNLYGPRCFMKVPAFTSFNVVSGLSPPAKPEAPKKKDLFVDFKSARSNKLRHSDVGMFHSSVMQACLHARQFKSAITVYFNNLSSSDDISNDKLQGSVCNFKVSSTDFSSIVSERTGGTFYDLVRGVLAKTARIEGTVTLKPPLQDTVDKDMRCVSELKAGKVLQCDEIWACTLMLKHALYNNFMSIDVTTERYGDDALDDKPQHEDVDLSEVLAPYSNLEHLGSLPNEYYQALIRKRMFRRLERESSYSVEEFMELFKDDNEINNPEDSAQTITKFINKPLGDTFLKSSAADDKPTLNSTIREMREDNLRLSDLGVTGIYSMMRRLLSFGISGTAAVKLSVLIMPEIRFQAWCHYDVFLCAFECDMERRDVASLDRLLDCMVDWACMPEPAMYARFFDICTSLTRDDLIMKHTRIYMSQRNGSHMSQGRSRFSLKPFTRVSFEMYCHLLSVYRRLGRYKEGLLAFKQLLCDVNGIYRIIPLTIWQVVRAIVEECGASHDLRALVEQCESLCKGVDVSRVLATHARNAQMYSRSVIARELESLIDSYVNSS